MKKKPNLKNESVLLTMCNIYSSGKLVGKGFSITRKDGRVIPVLSDLGGTELGEGDYSIRHTDEEYLGVVSWVVQ